MAKKVDPRPGPRPGIENYTPKKSGSGASPVPQLLADVRASVEKSWVVLSDVARHLTTKDLTRAGRAFAATVSQFNPRKGDAAALTAGLSAALTQLTMQPNYAELAEMYRTQLSELMHDDTGRATKDVGVVMEKYAACLAIGIANATLEYHIADTSGDKRHWQQKTTEFADTFFRISPPNEMSVHVLLASYAAVDLDIATLNHRVRENEGLIASPDLRPVSLPNEAAEIPQFPTQNERDAIQRARIENAELESLSAHTESHLLSQIDIARIRDDFSRYHHRGVALQLMGDPDRAYAEYGQARTVFQNGRDRNVAPTETELQNEVVILNRMAGLTTPAQARKYLGEASGMIDWLGITKPNLAKVMAIENKELMVPLTIQSYEAFFAKGKLSPEQFNKNVVREYQDIARHCASLTTSDPQIQAAIHDHLLINKVSALERDLGFFGMDSDETVERQAAAIHDFERAKFKYQLTASDDGWHESSGRAAWAMATHFFQHGKIEAALGYLRDIRERHPESTAADILRTPHQDLWVREFGVLTAGGQFSSKLGDPDFVAGLKTVGGKVFDDKAGAMKGIMAGAGVGLGVATADFIAGSHVFGGGVLAVTTGQLIFGGAVAGLTIERAHRLATSWEDISASYKLGVTHVRGEDLKNNAASFGIEIGSMFVGGFVGQAAKQGITRLGSRWLTQWLATRGVIYSDISLAREFLLVREAAYVGEGIIFHPVAGAARVAASSAINLPAYPIGIAPKDFFSSWLTLRTLGLVGAWNPGAIAAAGGRLADRATRALINNSISQAILTPAHAALSGDFSNLGLQYFTGLYDLLAIVAGQHTAKSIGQAKKVVNVFRAVGPNLVTRAQHVIQTVRKEAARYEQVPGPLLLMLPLLRENRAGITVLRIDLPGLPDIPLKQSREDRARMIADWAETRFATADVDSQQTQLAEISASCETWLDKAVMSADAAIAKFVSKKISEGRLLNHLKSIRHDWDVYTTIFMSTLDHISDDASREATVQNYEEARSRYQNLHSILGKLEADIYKNNVATISDHQDRLREAFGIADRSASGELQFAQNIHAKAVAIGDPQIIQDVGLILKGIELGGEKTATMSALHALARRIKPLWDQHRLAAKNFTGRDLLTADMERLHSLAKSGLVTDVEYDEIIRYFFTLGGIHERIKDYLDRSAKHDKPYRRSALIGLLFGMSRIVSVSKLLKQEARFLTKTKITIPDYDGFSQKIDLRDINAGIAKPLHEKSSVEVQNDVPMIEGHLWDLKSCVRYSYGTTVKAHNQVLKYQKAVEIGRAAVANGTFDPTKHVKSATIEVTGNVEPAFVTFISRYAPDVELLYALPLPDGHELIFPLKAARTGQTTLRRIYPPTPLTPREIRIARGIQRRIEFGTLVEIFNNTVLARKDIADSPFKDALIASERDGFINPTFIEDVEALKEYERLSYAKRIEILEGAADQPIRHRSNRLYRNPIDEVTIDEELKKVDAFIAESAPLIQKQYGINPNQDPELATRARAEFSRRIRALATFEKERIENEGDDVHAARARMGYSGPVHGYPLDPLHVYMDVVKSVRGNPDAPKKAAPNAKNRPEYGRNYTSSASFPTLSEIVTAVRNGEYQAARRKITVFYPAGARDDVALTREYNITDPYKQAEKLKDEMLDLNLKRLGALRDDPDATPRIKKGLHLNAKLLDEAHTRVLVARADREAAIMAVPKPERGPVAAIQNQKVHEVKEDLLKVYRKVLGKAQFDKLVVKVVGDHTDTITKFIYIVDANGVMRVCEESLEPGHERPTHSMLAGGRNVYASGEFYVRGLQVISINNGSGHYRPDAAETLNYVKAILQGSGFTITTEGKDATRLEHVKFPYVSIDSPVSHLWEGNVFPSSREALPADVVAEGKVEAEPALEMEPPKPPMDTSPKLALPGLPVLPLPLNGSAEALVKAVHDQSAAIADWLNIRVVDEPLDVQMKAVADLVRAHQEWLDSATSRLRKVVTGLESGSLTLDAAVAEGKRIGSEGKVFFLIHEGLQNSLGPAEKPFAMMMRSSLSQTHVAVSGVVDLLPFSFEPGDPSGLQFLHELLDGAHAVRTDAHGLSIPSALYESTRNILWWLDNHGQRGEGTFTWTTTESQSDHKPHKMLFDGYVWPPSPDRDPLLAVQLNLLGWELRVEGKGQRIVLKVPTDQILKPEPEPSFSHAAIEALPAILREAIRRHRFESISDEGVLTQAILKDPVAAGEGVLGQLANSMIWGALLEKPQNERLADIISKGAETFHRYLSVLSSLPQEIRPEGITATKDPTTDFLRALDQRPATHPTLRTILKYVDHEHHSNFLQKLD